MMDFETELEQALRRESPSPGFSARVLDRVEREGRGRAPRRWWNWRAVAAGVVLTTLAGGWAAHHELERREGERARREVLLALRLAGSKIRYVQEQVREVGSHED
jgi:hypothetical protein